MTEYVDEKVEEWIKEVYEFAITQTQASYAVYTLLLHFLRTLPDIQDLLQPLENAIAKVFLPAITEHECTQLEREILALPMRKGGLGVAYEQASLGVTNPCQEGAVEYAASTNITTPLVEQIQSQRHKLSDNSRIQSLKQIARKEKMMP